TSSSKYRCLTVSTPKNSKVEYTQIRMPVMGMMIYMTLTGHPVAASVFACIATENFQPYTIKYNPNKNVEAEMILSSTLFHDFGNRFVKALMARCIFSRSPIAIPKNEN